MSVSLAFKKFKSLDRSNSVKSSSDRSSISSFKQETEINRPSPDQGLGSSLASSTTSLQIPNKTETGHQNVPEQGNMAILRAQFFDEKVNKETKMPPNKEEVAKSIMVTKRKNSATLEEGESKRLNAVSQGNHDDIKNMFEEHIAVKKGIIPDPNLPQGPVVRMRRKVNPNLPRPFDKKEGVEENLGKKNRESVPIDRKMFNHFLNKFEDDQSRQAAKAQLSHLTQKQKTYNKKSSSWSQKQEEKRLEEERRYIEELEAQKALERKKAEEEELAKRRLEEEEMLKKQLEEEEKKKEEEAALLAEEKKKKTKKKPKKKGGESKELPNLVANTCSDLRRKFQESLKSSQEANSKTLSVEKPRARKRLENPFEKQLVNRNSDPQPMRKSELPLGAAATGGNRLSDIKKRFSQLISPTPDENNIDAAKNNKSIAQDDTVHNDQENKDNVDNVLYLPMKALKSPKCSPKPLSRASALQEVIRRSKETLLSSNERLSGAFSNKKQKKPSIADMQGYLISHVLYDGEVKMDMEEKNEKKDDHDDLLDFLEEEPDIPEEELMKDEYIRGLQMYLSVLEEAPKKSKKKKKKKKVEEPSGPALKTQQVNSIKEQFEIRKRALKSTTPKEPLPKSANEPKKLHEEKISKVKSLFETPKSEDSQAPIPAKRQSRTISNALIKKFDCPEAAEELKRQREKEREERKQERLKKLEEERKRIEEEMIKARKREEERLEQERQEKLRKEEEARQEILRKEEEERMKVAYEKMIAEEKKKAEMRRVLDEEQKKRREKSEPAFKQKKVLGRIQHMFQKKLDEDGSKRSNPVINVGSVKGLGEELFYKKDDQVKSPTHNDPTLAGVGGVLNSVKNKFEAAKDTEPIPLTHGVPLKKKDLLAALTFAQIEEKMKSQTEIMSPKTQQQTDWSWKKKDPGQLASELNKLDKVGENESSNERKKSSRAEKALTRQSELLNDIHEMNSRLAKKNPIKEHEEKMEEYSKFMEEIQDYLTEPDNTNEESTFKDDIKTLITTKLASKKVKPKKAVVQKQQITKTSVNKIKEQLLNSTDATDGKSFEPSITKSGKVENLKESIIQLYNGERANKTEDPIEISSSVNTIKDMFEANDSQESYSLEKAKVKKKIVQVDHAEQPVSQAQKKSSYEWKYKKKSIQELQDFMSCNKGYVSDSVNKAVEEAKDSLVDSVLDDSNDVREQNQLSSYNKMMDEVEHYLNEPDRNMEEIEFKEQIEQYLDLVEMPTKEKEKVETSTLKRKPKKLDMSLYIKESESNTSFISENSPTLLKSQESKSVKDLQNKLFNDKQSPVEMAKENVIVHNVGTKHLKKGFEKMNREEKMDLVSAPKVTAQRFFGDMLSDATNSSAKSLEQLKTEGKENTWKWKHTAIGDLHTYMTGHLSHASQEIIESHKNILKADIELQNIKPSLVNKDQIKILSDERDAEMEQFLENVKDYLSKPTKSYKEESVKSGIQSYLNLLVDGPSKDMDLSSKDTDEVCGQIKFLPSGQVQNARHNLEESKRNTLPLQTKQPVGKLKTSPFIEESQNSAELGKQSNHTGSKMSKRYSEDIKESLVKKFFVEAEPKELLKAPKTKLVQAPKANLGDQNAKPIEPKRQWKPPENHRPVQKDDENKSKKKPKREEKKFVSKYAHITDENERKAAILAQFGCKPRQNQKVEESLSESSEDEDMTNYIENDLMKNNLLYVTYGDRLREPSPKKQVNQRKKNESSSVDVLKGLLGTLRKTTSRQELESSSDSLSLDESPERYSNIPGSCTSIRARFERDQYQEYENVSRNTRHVEKSSSFSNVGRLYEDSIDSKKAIPGSGFQPSQINRKIDPRGITNHPTGIQSQGFLPGLLAKSASFHKLKQSFEMTGNQTNQYESDEEDDCDEDYGLTEQRSQIECELEELRSCTRLQKMFSINRPKGSALERSSSSSAIPDYNKRTCDDEDIPTVSEARSSIKNIFEASASKVTYGGGKSLTEQLREKEQEAPKKKVQFSERKWVMDSINKYFDVIDEDEEEEVYDEDCYSDEEDSENDEQVFSTQVSAQRVVYPSAMPPHQVAMNTQYSQQQMTYEEPDEEEEYEVELEVEEEEYEEENCDDVSEDEEEDEDEQPQGHSYSLLQKSASSSRIRGLFNTALYKSPSSTSMNLDNFKANLTRHLRRRESFNSNQNVGQFQQQQSDDEDEDDDDDDCFEDCQEVPMETSKFYRIPL